MAQTGESTCLSPMWPGFDSQTRRHRWVEFVGSLGSVPRGFSPGTLFFPHFSKNLVFDVFILFLFSVLNDNSAQNKRDTSIAIITDLFLFLFQLKDTRLQHFLCVLLIL